MVAVLVSEVTLEAVLESEDLPVSEDLLILKVALEAVLTLEYLLVLMVALEAMQKMKPTTRSRHLETDSIYMEFLEENVAKERS